MVRSTLVWLLLAGVGLAGCGGGSKVVGDTTLNEGDIAANGTGGPVNAGATDDTGAIDDTATANNTGTADDTGVSDASIGDQALLDNAGDVETGDGDQGVNDSAQIALDDDASAAQIPLQDVNSDGVVDASDIDLILSATTDGDNTLAPLGDEDLSAVLTALLADGRDTDGDGILDRDDAVAGGLFLDLDEDGIPDYYDDDVDGDGLLNTEDADFTGDLPDTDADGIPDRFDAVNGVVEPSADMPCGQESGSVADGSFNDWSDNCVIRSNRVGGQFANSAYTLGIQRIVFCAGFGDGEAYSQFATGEFGSATEAALIEYQRANDITGDGEVGPQTWETLRDELEVLETGALGGQPDALGLAEGRCAGSTLFYQDTEISDDGLGVDLLGFSLAGNPPNEARELEFSIRAAVMATVALLP